jgi:hypothetical protein
MTLPDSNPERRAVDKLKETISNGKHWYIALLEAIGKWTLAKEIYNGRSYQYLIASEAFDLILLAERLCQETEYLLPDSETTALLFHNKPPLQLAKEAFKKLIGGIKYRQYLNYFYGIIVEESLILAVQEEIRKEHWTAGYNNDRDTNNETYQRIYGATKTTMLRRFRKEMHRPQKNSIDLTEMKELTYWLFKYRLKQCDKAKVASDTKKALNKAKKQQHY